MHQVKQVTLTCSCTHETCTLQGNIVMEIGEFPCRSTVQFQGLISCVFFFVFCFSLGSIHVANTTLLSDATGNMGTVSSQGSRMHQ